MLLQLLPLCNLEILKLIKTKYYWYAQQGNYERILEEKGNQTHTCENIFRKIKLFIDVDTIKPSYW